MSTDSVPRKTLHAHLFKCLYTELKKEFFKKEWASESVEVGTQFALWKKRDSDGELTVYRLFGVRHKFFYDRNSEAEAGQNITLKVEILCKILLYLDCRGETVRAMLDAFYVKGQVPVETIALQAELEKSRQYADVLDVAPDQHFTAEKIHQKTFNNYTINIVNGAQDAQSDIERLLYQFYEEVATATDAGYERAWTMLSTSFKNRIWMPKDTGSAQGPTEKEGLALSKFKNGYYFFRSLRETHVFNVKVYPTIAYAMVYYEEELELPYVEELADINKIAIKNVASLVEKVSTLRGIVEGFGGTGFADKAFIRLFYPTATETLWFEHGMNPVAFKAAFPATSTTNVARLLRCKCTRENDRWFIDSLVPLHCRAI